MSEDILNAARKALGALEDIYDGEPDAPEPLMSECADSDVFMRRMLSWLNAEMDWKERRARDAAAALRNAIKQQDLRYSGQSGGSNEQ